MKNLKFTFKAWPVITAVTIGLCYLTQLGAKVLFDIELPEQNQLQVVRAMAGWNWPFFKVLLMVLVFAPAFEELLFRFCLYKLPAKLVGLFTKSSVPAFLIALLGSAVFSAAHYPDWAAIKATGQWAWLPLSNAFLALGFFGLAQCWLYRKTTWMWCPILNHLLFNLTNLVLLFIVPL